MFPFSVFVKKLWWDVIMQSSDTPVSVQGLQKVANESCSLLRDALMPFVDNFLKVSRLSTTSIIERKMGHQMPLPKVPLLEAFFH